MERHLVYKAYVKMNKENATIVIPEFHLNFVSNTTELYKIITISRRKIIASAAEMVAADEAIPEPDSSEYKKDKSMITLYIDVILDTEIKESEEDISEFKKRQHWESKENVVEFYSNEETMYCTLTKRRYINRVKRYAEENPDDVKIISENTDGSIYASLPLKYLKITRPNAGREYTEEEKRISRERLNMYRNQKKKEGQDPLFL